MRGKRTLLRREARARDTTFVLTEAQMRLLEKAGNELIPQQHVQSAAPGELLCQDTF